MLLILFLLLIKPDIVARNLSVSTSSNRVIFFDIDSSIILRTGSMLLVVI
jgi:hypothetical protein